MRKIELIPRGWGMALEVSHFWRVDQEREFEVLQNEHVM